MEARLQPLPSVGTSRIRESSVRSITYPNARRTPLSATTTLSMRCRRSASVRPSRGACARSQVRLRQPTLSILIALG